MEAAVVDAGSKLLKAGPAIPDQAPSMVIPSQMKRMLEDGSSSVDNSTLVEDVTVDPVVRGFIRDWDAMEDLLHHVLYAGLGWEEGNEGQILFTDPLCSPKAVREQLVQLMFETFNISGFYSSEQAVLSLYAVGRISGCTVDIGHGKIDIAPVIEGAVQHIASRRFEVGGMDLTKLLAQELGKTNPSVNLSLYDVEKLKEQFSCCAEDELAYEKTQKSCEIEQHTLPDGQVIRIGKERYTVGEALFQPSILGLEAHGIVEQLVHTISTVSSENHRQLLENTVLCGGTTSMAGFEDRFQKEAGLCSSAIRPTLVKPPEYMPENLTLYSAWIGGAILAKVVFPQNKNLPNFAAASFWRCCRCRFLLTLLPPADNCLCFLLASRSSSHRCFLYVHCCCCFALALLWSLPLPLPSRLLTLLWSLVTKFSKPLTAYYSLQVVANNWRALQSNPGS